MRSDDLRSLHRTTDQVSELLKAAIGIGDGLTSTSLVRFNSLLLAVRIEVGLRKLLHEPALPAPIGQSVPGNVAMEDMWQHLIEAAFRVHYAVPIGTDLDAGLGQPASNQFGI